MKWIGQHIYDQISRFRNDVYLESSAKLNFRDANSYVSSPAANELDVVATSILSIKSDSLQLSSVSTNDPLLLITNTTDDRFGARIKLYKNRGADGQDGDSCGLLQYTSFDDGTPSGQLYGQMETLIHDATNGQESGKMEFGVANHDGGMGTGLMLQGGSANNEVDVTIGLGASSVTTVSGTLTMGSTAALTNAGLVAVANQSNITGVGTISSGVWRGDAIASAYIGDDQITEDKLADTLLAEIDANTAKATNVTTNLTATTHASQITINSSDGTNVIVAEASGSIAGVMSVTHHDKLDAIEASATADQSKSDIDGLAITTVGTLDTGNATAIVSAASATAAGKVELATTGEADTGTDTARAVTPAGLKSHVDTRYAYSYMTWSASGTSSMNGSDPEWVFPNTVKGIYEEDWTKDENIIATSVGSTAFTTSRQTAVNALVIPHTGVCVGFHATGRNDDNDTTFRAGLFHYDGSTTSATNTTGIDYGATGNTHECTLRWIATANEAEASGGADSTGGHSFKGPCKLVSNVTNTFAVTAGDALMPAIMGPDASDEIFITMTIILKIPLA